MANTEGYPFSKGDAGSHVVANTVLRVLGGGDSGDWASGSACNNGNQDRWIELCNCSATNTVYVRRAVTGAADLTGAVSSTDFVKALVALETAWIFVSRGYDLCVIGAAGSTDKVRAHEHVIHF